MKAVTPAIKRKMTVRELTNGAPREVGRVVLRLKMAIQKENYDKITTAFEELNQILNP